METDSSKAVAMITKDKKIKYFIETMSVYRQHGSGVWNSDLRVQNFIKTLTTAQILNKHLVKPEEKKYTYWPMHYAYVEQISHYKNRNLLKVLYYYISFKLLDFRYKFIFNKNRGTD